MRSGAKARTVVSRGSIARGGAKPKDWGGGCGVGGGSEASPEEVLLEEERLSALPGPFHSAGLS